MSEKPAADKRPRPESITTKPDMDFASDDEAPTPATAAHPTISPQPKKVSFQEPAIEEDETPPPKPPRPMSPMAQAEATLIEAFPDTDPKVVKAVLVASNGKVEPAFNALLSMSDPNFKAEDVPPPQPPRPSQPRTQVEQDELYARQLAAHFQSSGSRPLPQHRAQPSEDDREHSFFDDDLPVIQENIKKGFLETQSKLNKFFTDFKKKLDGEEDDEPQPGQAGSSQYRRQNFGPSQSDQMYGIRRSAEGRRSADRERYDADPRVLGDDFAGLELRDNEANPNLFKPTPKPPQSGPVDEVDALYRNPTPPRQPSPGANKTKKWQPLTSVAPNPEADDHDPFSLGDSDDEQEAKTKDIKADDSERLKKAAAESDANDKKDSGSSPGPEERERSGSVGQKDKVAEELLTGKK
ncbi:Ubiquitin system component Cue [Macrophomina phaseolina MS6]|uniref:Ubiquitin system component Cue n=1 Tax=Macrophomina phaseolina (strain MS6) TaxID=1126212 RepID=K2RV67_MACPH|nr:Ubiquitin system component Cue [Macrophomina phaseolina MS6]